MTYFINQTEYDALTEQRNNINLAIENLLLKELEMKGHIVSNEEIEEEKMHLFFCLEGKDAKYEMLTNEYVLGSIFGAIVDEDESEDE